MLAFTLGGSNTASSLSGRAGGKAKHLLSDHFTIPLSSPFPFLKVRQIKTVETDEEQAAGTDENANKVVQFRCVHPGLGVYYVIVVQSFVY